MSTAIAPRLQEVVAETHRIACPYEPIGKALLVVTRKSDGLQADLGTPLKCDYCGRYFRLGAKLSFYGKPLE